MNGSEPRKMGLGEAKAAQEATFLSEKRRIMSSPDAVRNILTYSLTIGYAQTEAQRLGKLAEFRRVVGEANNRINEIGPDAVLEACASVIGPFTVPPEWQVGSGTPTPEEEDDA